MTLSSSSLILVAVLGVIARHGLALVRARSRRDATCSNRRPSAPGVPAEVKEDVARHVADRAPSSRPRRPRPTGVEVDAALAAAVDEAMAAAGRGVAGQAPVPRPAGQGPHAALGLRRLGRCPRARSTTRPGTSSRRR